MKNTSNNIAQLEKSMRGDGYYEKKKTEWTVLSKQLKILIKKKWNEHDWALEPYDLLKSAHSLIAEIYHETYFTSEEEEEKFWSTPEPKHWSEIKKMVKTIDNLLSTVSKVRSKERKQNWPLLAKAWAKKLKVTLKRIKPVGETKRSEGKIMLPRSDKYSPIHKKLMHTKDKEEVWMIGLRYNYAAQKTYAVLQSKDRNKLHRQLPAADLRSIYK